MRAWEHPRSLGSSGDLSDAPVGSTGKGAAGKARLEPKAASRITIIIPRRQQSKRFASQQYAANMKTGRNPRRRPNNNHKLQPGERKSKAKQQRKTTHLSRRPQKTMVARRMSSVHKAIGHMKIARRIFNAIAIAIPIADLQGTITHPAHIQHHLCNAIC